MLVFNVKFINTDNQPDETQVEVSEYNQEDAEITELINLILGLKDELGIKKVTHIECVDCYEDEEEY